MTVVTHAPRRAAAARGFFKGKINNKIQIHSMDQIWTNISSVEL
jgi:hypothetical protein